MVRINPICDRRRFSPLVILCSFKMVQMNLIASIFGCLKAFLFLVVLSYVTKSREYWTVNSWWMRYYCLPFTCMDSSTSYNLKSRIPLFWRKAVCFVLRGSKISRLPALKLLKAYMKSPDKCKIKWEFKILLKIQKEIKEILWKTNDWPGNVDNLGKKQD